jgi:hypothetical protein
MSDWHLFLAEHSDAEHVAETLEAVYKRAGYGRFDPFPGGSPTPPAYKTFARHFVGEPQAGWIQIFGLPHPTLTDALIAALSAGNALLRLSLSAENWAVSAHLSDADDNLLHYARTGVTATMLTQAGQTQAGSAGKSSGLHPEVDQMMREAKVNPLLARGLIHQMTGQVMKQLEGDLQAGEKQAAQQMLSGPARPNWESAAGRRLLAVAALLNLPPNWREPDFDTLRDAYQVARRLAKTPSARLAANEQAALARLPNAIQYRAVYMGRAE